MFGYWQDLIRNTKDALKLTRLSVECACNTADHLLEIVLRESLVIAFLVLVGILSPGCVVPSADTATNRSFANGGPKIESDENLVSITFDEEAISRKTFEEVMEGAAPTVILRVDCATGNADSAQCAEVRLSAEALQLIAEYWKPALGFQFLEVNDAYEDGQAFGDASRRHLSNSNAFVNRIQKMQILTPSGNRMVSSTESEQILGALNKKAVEIVKERFVFPELNRRKISRR